VAYQDWLSGAAARYDKQLTRRYSYLLDQEWSGNDPVVPPLTDPPTTLLFGDITPSEYDWSNQAYAEFFGKKKVTIPR
jgi:hypothetical protein